MSEIKVNITQGDSGLSLVVIRESIPVISSIKLAEGLNLEHRVVLQNIKRHWEKIQRIRPSALEVQKSGGRDTTFMYLDEAQSLFVGMMSRNTEEVTEFKFKLAIAFVEANKKILRLESELKELREGMAPLVKDSNWLQLRENGKVTRRNTTDVVKEFVEYATAQGSTNAHKYYQSISKMQNKALFFLAQKFKNLRDNLDYKQLSIMVTADIAVAKAIHEGMERGDYYKDIYKQAKAKVLQISGAVGVSEVVPLESANRVSLAA